MKCMHQKLDDCASYAHDAWSGWMKYMFSLSNENDDGSVTIPVELVARWKRQMDTSYYDLSEDEQFSDQVESVRYLYFAFREKPIDRGLVNGKEKVGR